MAQVRDDEALICEWLKKGDEYYLADRYEEAVPCFQQVLEINPKNLNVLRKLDVALGNLGRYEEAISSFERSIDFSHYDPAWAWSNRGRGLADLGRHEEAIASYERAIELKPDSNVNWSNRGIALANLGRYEEAIASYERSIELKPDSNVNWSNRGIALARLGRYEKAIASYDRAIEIKPDLREAWTNRGIAKGNLHGYHAEINAYHEAFQHIKSDTHPEGWGLLQHVIGLTHYQEGKDRLFSDRKNPQPYYYQALSSYQQALTTLTRTNSASTPSSTPPKSTSPNATPPQLVSAKSKPSISCGKKPNPIIALNIGRHLRLAVGVRSICKISIDSCQLL
jgi:tetratricopeptide (TPR) repeat protein